MFLFLLSSILDLKYSYLDIFIYIIYISILQWYYRVTMEVL